MVDIKQGNCLELMKEIPDKSVDMVLCDLPYGTTAWKWDIVIPFEPLWNEYKRIIKSGGVIALFGRQPFTSFVVQSNLPWWRYELIWEKDKGTDFLLLVKLVLPHVENTLFILNKGIFS